MAISRFNSIRKPVQPVSYPLGQRFQGITRQVFRPPVNDTVTIRNRYPRFGNGKPSIQVCLNTDELIDLWRFTGEQIINEGAFSKEQKTGQLRAMNRELDEWQKYQAFYPERFSKSFAAYMKDEQGHLVAGAIVTPIPKGSLPLSVYEPNSTWYLRNLAIRKDYRGQGIGREMLERVIQEARKHRIRKIFLTPNNETTEAIYRHMGFRWFGSGYDLMQKYLWPTG